jgi:hypothetical protein
MMRARSLGRSGRMSDADFIPSRRKATRQPR